MPSGRWLSNAVRDWSTAFIQTQQAKRLIVVVDACYSNGAYTNIVGFPPQVESP